MSPSASLVYAFDPLCGWCYGFVPAMEELARVRPDVRIELRLGGLVTGARIGPYAAMSSYIRGASERLFAVTGQRLLPPFFERILGSAKTVGSSIPPSAVILAVREHARDHVLAFAHAVQRAHFEEGEDLNDEALYVRLLAQRGLSLRVPIPPPEQAPPELAVEFEATRAMGGVSFPSVFVRQGTALQPLPTVYEPRAWVEAVDAAMRAARGASA